MSRPPPKKAVGVPTPPQQKTVGSKVYQTRLTTATAQANKRSEPDRQASLDAGSNTNNGEKNVDVAAKEQADVIDNPPITPLRIIADELACITQEEAVDSPTRKCIEALIEYARATEAEERQLEAAPEGQAKVSTLRYAIRKDMQCMFEGLVKHIRGAQEILYAAMQSSMDKVLKEVGESAALAKDLANKIGKVSEATNKIASGDVPYRDALLTEPKRSNRANADPRILSDMDRKAKQILVKIYDTEGNDTLAKSLTELVSKANEAIASIEDADKPKDIKVLAALKMRRQTLLLTLNSKEAVAWFRDASVEIAFTSTFSEGSHIEERTYSIIVPRVPITFEPSDEKHLRELEEVNDLDKRAIVKAKWIKPIGRRRADQTHAYAILSLTSADCTNMLIRDGLLICGTKTRPYKQKQEPIQCMKCRSWGHFASDCPAKEDICGTCGGTHRSNNCDSRNKLHCISCKADMHASWDRNCPEFIRRCAILQERNPQNAMPYYPTDHDWTLTERPSRISLEERFPVKYAANKIKAAGDKSTATTQRQPSGAPSRSLQKSVPRRGSMARSNHENPNLIPIDQGRGTGALLSKEDLWRAEPASRSAEAENTDKSYYANPSGW